MEVILRESYPGRDSLVGQIDGLKQDVQGNKKLSQTSIHCLSIKL